MGTLPDKRVLTEFFIQPKQPEPYFDNNNDILTNANETISNNFNEFSMTPPDLSDTEFIEPREYGSGQNPSNFTLYENTIEIFWFIHSILFLLEEFMISLR